MIFYNISVVFGTISGILSVSMFLLLGGIVSYFLNGYIYSIFSNNKILDPITSRSSHRSKATRSGGLSVFLSICLCLAIAGSTNSLSINPYLYLSVLFMALTGIADDFFNVRYRENLMGWISANNTNSQLKYQFASKDLAIKFAQNHNYDYIIKEAAKTRIKPKSYSANFTKPIL